MKAVIFDLDGTLVDSQQAHYRAFKSLLEKLKVKLTFEKYLKYFPGRTDFDGLAGILGKKKSLVKLVREKNRVLIGLIPFFVKPFGSTAGAAGLARKKGLKMGVATSAPRIEANALLAACGLRNVFEIVVCGDEVRKGKPAPDIYLLAAKKLGVKPRDCVVVEDSVSGVASAKAAKMKCIAVTHTFPSKLLKKANVVIDDRRASGSKMLFKKILEQLR